MSKDFWKGLLVGAFIVVAIVFVTVLAELDDDVKSGVVNTFSNIENPIKVVPGNKAMESYEFPVDPAKGASCLGHGPTCGQSLITSSDSPDNSLLGMQRAFITFDDDKFYLFVLVVEPGITLIEDWRYLGNFTSIANIMWVENSEGIDDDQLIFNAGSKACVAFPATEAIECH